MLSKASRLQCSRATVHRLLTALFSWKRRRGNYTKHIWKELWNSDIRHEVWQLFTLSFKLAFFWFSFMFLITFSKKLKLKWIDNKEHLKKENEKSGKTLKVCLYFYTVWDSKRNTNVYTNEKKCAIFSLIKSKTSEKISKAFPRKRGR